MSGYMYDEHGFMYHPDGSPVYDNQGNHVNRDPIYYRQGRSSGSGLVFVLVALIAIGVLVFMLMRWNDSRLPGYMGQPVIPAYVPQLEPTIYVPAVPTVAVIQPAVVIPTNTAMVTGYSLGGALASPTSESPFAGEAKLCKTGKSYSAPIEDANLFLMDIPEGMPVAIQGYNEDSTWAHIFWPALPGYKVWIKTETFTYCP